MSTPSSSEYFNQVAGQWDDLRAGYFSEAVRQAAIAKAYLRPEMVVADVGAGTGFMTAGLAPLVRRVYALDASPAMLEVARKNLRDFDNVVYREAEGESLPLPDESLDAVFANMVLHHCLDPLAALREMARVLRPGGRLVITDLDAHPHTWMKAEMADVWLGFERSQVREWLKEAGLVNRIVDCTGQSCCAEAQGPTLTDREGRQAEISIFVATGSRPVQGVRQAVQQGYGDRAEGKSGVCCSPSTGDEAAVGGSTCCGGASPQASSTCSCSGGLAPEEINIVPLYSDSEKDAVPEEAAQISLGCGNPTAFATLREGQTVLDIGSGGGMDAFLAAGRVGKSGKVIGVDMTPAMLERARRAAERGGFDQVEFRQGQAEALPVEDASVDVIISNCVINLCEDKGQVFSEAARVLKAGGRLEVSDMVTDKALPGDLIEDPANWAGCVFGALPEREYLDLVAQAGFEEISVRRSATAGEVGGTKIYSLLVSARRA